MSWEEWWSGLTFQAKKKSSAQRERERERVERDGLNVMSMPTGLRVQLASFNANQMFDGTGVPDMREWLVPTVNESRRSGYMTTDEGRELTAMSLGPREAPDIYAVAFQEFAPLHKALSGTVSQARTQADLAIRRCVRHHQSIVRDDKMYDPLELGGGPENYAKIADVNHAGLVLFVYARERAPQRAHGTQISAAHRVKEVRASFVGTGLGMVMGNKGAVGARVVLASAVPGGRDEVLTFVGAHLAAHDHNVARRNAEWRSICERMVFDLMSVQLLPVLQEPPSLAGDDGDEKHGGNGDGNGHGGGRGVHVESVPTMRGCAPELQSDADAADDNEYSLYDTHHLFVLGDLNYRVATGVHGVSPRGQRTVPGKYPPITKSDVHEVARSFQSDRWASLVPYDQLLLERYAPTPRTLHGLHVPDMAQYGIPPTYKYKARGEMEQLSKKRLPGWPDRLLWGTSDASYAASGTLRCELYRSLMRYTSSDHKPITAIVQLPHHLHPLSDFLPVPYALHPNWRTWRLVGVVLDRLVGYAWSCLLLLGHGHLYVAVAELLLLTTVGWYYVQGRW